MGADPAIQANIKHFYKVNYWNTVKLDQVEDQRIANNLFDCSVNQGDGIARKFMQEACNIVIGWTNAEFPKLAIDLTPGIKTISTLNSLPASRIMNAINSLRTERYHASIGFTQWGKIWLKRLTNYV